MMTKALVTILCVICFLITIATQCFGYLTMKAIDDAKKPAWQLVRGDIVGTHNNMTDYSIDNLDFSSGIKDVLILNRASINKGNRLEDDENLGNALYHFYNPILPDFQPGLYGGSAKVNGKWSFSENAKNRAIRYYEEAKKIYSKDGANGVNSAWENIGRALHLLQDMAVPAHVNRANHWQHATKWYNGYEWWVAGHWDDSRDENNFMKYRGFLIKPYLDYLKNNNPYFKRPIVAGNMAGYMDSLAVQTYYGYEWDEAPLTALVYNEDPLIDLPVSHAVGDEEARHTASVLVPSAIMVGGGLLQSFCKEVNCTGQPNPGEFKLQVHHVELG